MLGQKCHRQPPHLRVPLPPRAPSWCLPGPCGTSQPGSRSPALLGSAPEAAAWTHSWVHHIRYFLHVLARKVGFVLLDSLCWVRIISTLWGKTGAGLFVLPSVHKHQWSTENAPEYLLASPWFCLFTAISTALLRRPSLLCLAVFTGLSIGPGRFWRLRGEWNLSFWHAEAGLAGLGTGDSSACPGLF